jgi:polar amino acid transport system substrate-binding protein
MIRRSINDVFLLVFGLTMAASAAHALTLLTEENPPFNYTDQGKVVGISTEIVSELGKRSGIVLQIQSMPWEKAYIAVQADKETCLYSTARLVNRERLFSWIGPIATNKWVLIGKGDFAGTVKTVEDARKYRVGVVAKDAKIEYLMSKGVTDLREVNDDSLNPARLVLSRDDPNRIDLWVTGAYGARRTAARAKVKDIKLVLALRDVPLYLACGMKTSTQTIQALSRALEQINKDGTLKRITDRHAF